MGLKIKTKKKTLIKIENNENKNLEAGIDEAKKEQVIRSMTY